MRLKKLLGIVGLGLSLALIVTGCSKNSSSKKEVTFATVGTTKPFSYQNDKGKLTGFDVEVAREIFKGSKDYKFNKLMATPFILALILPSLILSAITLVTPRKGARSTSIPIQRPQRLPF